MSDGTGIEWTDASWQTVSGCSRISLGCGTNLGGCYAEKMAWRLSHNPQTPQYAGTARMTEHGPRWTGTVTPYLDDILLPLRWRKPRRVFVNSMSDLFHEDVPDEHIDRVFATMLASELLTNLARHTYQVLTKRADRARRYLTVPPAELLERWGKAGDGRIIMDNADVYFSEHVYGSCLARWDENGCATEKTAPWQRPENLFPLRNVWIGTSVENQEWADKRIPDLLACPAAVRWLSVEPMLGPVDLGKWLPAGGAQWQCSGCGAFAHASASRWSNDCPACGKVGYLTGSHAANGKHQPIQWVVAGAESGAKARPMAEEWVRSLRDQCEAAGVPFFYKQRLDEKRRKVSLPVLDGKQHAEYPR